MSLPLDLSDADVRALGEGELLQRDDVFSRASVRACSAQLKKMDAGRRFPAAGVASPIALDPRIRGDRTAWEADAPGTMVGLRQLFETVRGELNAEAWLGLAAFTIQLAIFDAQGAGYAPHRDALAGDPARRATAILYLNPDWQPAHGGCLRVHPPSGTRDIAPLGGRMVVFLSGSLLHEVLPSYHDRHAATAWYCGRSSDPWRSPARD